jgi:hypothetical protein
MRDLCAGTSRSDTTTCHNCSAIASCPLGSTYYVDMDMCNSGNESLLTIDRVCKICKKCPPGYWEKSPCTLFSDRECVRCTTCRAEGDEGTYQTSPCGKYADTGCANCTWCKPVVERYHMQMPCCSCAIEACEYDVRMPCCSCAIEAYDPL